MGLLTEEGGDGCDDALLFLVPQLRKDGQGEHFTGGALALRKIALFVAQGGERLLLVELEAVEQHLAARVKRLL